MAQAESAEKAVLVFRHPHQPAVYVEADLAVGTIFAAVVAAAGRIKPQLALDFLPVFEGSDFLAELDVFSDEIGDLGLQVDGLLEEVEIVEFTDEIADGFGGFSDAHAGEYNAGNLRGFRQEFLEAGD
jgi:hypothetical protein